MGGGELWIGNLNYEVCVYSVTYLETNNVS